jgi:hypothetical protein
VVEHARLVGQELRQAQRAAGITGQQDTFGDLGVGAQSQALTVAVYDRAALSVRAKGEVVAKKDKDKKKSAKKAGKADSVRAAVESTFAAAAGGSQKRAQELVEELSTLANRVRDTVDVGERIEQLRSEVQGLAQRVAAIESAPPQVRRAAQSAAGSARSRASGTRSSSGRSTASRATAARKAAATRKAKSGSTSSTSRSTASKSRSTAAKRSPAAKASGSARKSTASRSTATRSTASRSTASKPAARKTTARKPASTRSAPKSSSGTS